MKKEIIPVKFDTLQTVFHVSDIHIRNVRRHKEYREVFDRLYKELRKDTKNAICVVAGDIVHAKLEMSPELVDLAFEFFRNLSKIMPTIVITGNHDCNLSNKSRMDALSPIIYNVKSKNLFYLRDSGIYSVADTSFVVMSVFDDPKDYITADKVKGDTKIALYHGTINQAVSDTGFHLHNDKVKITTFKGYDIGLFGDVHAKQTISKYKTEEKIVDETELDKHIKNGWEIIEEVL